MSWNYDAQANARENLQQAARQGHSPSKKSYGEIMKEKRAALRTISPKAFQEVWGREDAYKELLDIYERFTLSPVDGSQGAGISNAALIYSQRPNAVCLKMFDEYNAQHTSITAGQSAIDLLAPYTTVRNGEPVTFYNPIKVFDVSQTNAKLSVPQRPEPDPLKIIHAIANAERFSIDYADLPDGVGALYIPENDEVLVQDGQTPHSMCVSLLTEYSHYQLARANGYQRDHTSVLACSSTYVLARHYGMDTSEMNFPKEAFPEAEGVGAIKELLSTVASVSKRVAKDIDQQLSALEQGRSHREPEAGEVQR